MPKAFAIRFVEFEGGCLIPLSHKLNRCGHFLKGWGDGFEYFHRFIWRAHNGPIPPGHDIHHTCEHKACQNPAHLACIPSAQHTSEHNAERHEEDSKDAKAFWLEHRCSAGTLASLFNLSRTTSYRWIQRWT